MTIKNLEEIGKRIRKSRKIMGYSREEFAEIIGISVRFTADIELGKKGMSLDTLIKICETLSVSADYLIWGRGERDGDSIAEITAFLDDSEMKYAEELMRTFVKAAADLKSKKHIDK